MEQPFHPREFDPRLADTVGIAKHLKEKTVQRQGPDANNLIPMLELRRDGVLLTMAVLDGERNRQLALLHDLVAMSDADQAVMILDMYGWHAPAVDGQPPDVPLGDLARRFAAGDPDVYECLQLYSAHRDGVDVGVQLGYSCRRRRVRWVKPSPITRPLGGAYPGAVRQGYEAQAKRPVPALEPEQIATLLECTLITAKLTPPPRNGPCPCGSGMKAKHCCWTAT